MIKLYPADKTLLILIFYLFTASASFASFLPGVDSLVTRLKAEKRKMSFSTDTNAVVLLEKVAQAYLYNKPDSALFYDRYALQLVKKQNAPKLQASVMNDMAKAFYIMGQYDQSFDASEQAMAISRKISFQSGLASSINNKGLIYLAQDKFAQAISQFEKALGISLAIKDSAKISANDFDLGLSYGEMKQFAKAFIWLTKASRLSEASKNWHIYVMTTNRIGETYYSAGNYISAIKYYQQVLNFAFYHDNWEYSFANSGLAQSYLALGKFDNAIEFANKSLDYSDRMKASWDAERAVEILAKAYAGKADFKNAFKYETLLKNYSDTLFDKAKEKEIDYLHLKEKEQENLNLEKENLINKREIEQTKLVIIIISLVVVFLVIIISVINQTNKQKTLLNEQLTSKNQDIILQSAEILAQKEALIVINQGKDELFSVISHDLRSPIATIHHSLGMLRNGDLTKDEFELFFSRFEQDTGLVLSMINNLLNWANSQQMGIVSAPETINFADVVDEILTVSRTQAENKKQLLIHEPAAEPLLINADINHVKIVVHNLVGNAIKFTPEGGIIRIFYSQTDDFTAVHIKDSGVGISAEKQERLFKVIGQKISDYGTNKEPGTGIGLMLIKQLIEKNDGRIEVKSKPAEGSEFIVFFKNAG